MNIDKFNEMDKNNSEESDGNNYNKNLKLDRRDSEFEFKLT
jgi:hypothetical protein